MRILHLASFVGNIGDIANHEGLYRELKNLLDGEITIDKLEMRLFYKNNQQRKFDESFAELVNEYDLLIIGGGNFFELCWEYSATGTTLDISRDILKLIKTPIYINGMGIDLDKGYSELTITKFREFLNNIFTLNKVFFTVRNDGSEEVVTRYFKEYKHLIHVIPDYGFFIKDVLEACQISQNEPKYIGFNLAVDMFDIRFKYRDYQQFIKGIGNVINEVLETYNINIYLFAHIQSDYIAITDVMKHINNYFLRSRVSISSLVVGDELASFKRYSQCKMILGMRNHSTICSIGLGIPSFGMTSYKKPEYIYSDVGLENRYINLANQYFFEKITEEIHRLLSDEYYESKIKSKYIGVLNVLEKRKNTVNIELAKWFRDNNLV